MILAVFNDPCGNLIQVDQAQEADMRCARVLGIGWLLLAVVASAQQPAEKKETGRPAFVPASARLAAAKTALLKKSGGSAIPFNVISTSVEGWGRFQVVEEPEKADVVIEVIAPEESGGVTVSSQTTTDRRTGRPEQSTTSSRALTGGGAVRLLVTDARTKAQLWSESEPVKFAVKQKAKEDNLVEAAQRLMRKLREKLEPAQ